MSPVNSGTFTTTRVQERRRTRARRINYGPATDLEIWEVARAATAAPLYFEPYKVKTMVLTDGGFGPNNNPTQEGIWEVEEATGTDSLGTVVSIGTARKSHPPAKSFIQKIKGMVDRLGDPEAIHKQVLKLQEDREKENAGFNYFRLNDPGALDIELDEWKPRPRRFGKKSGSGSVTIGKIEAAFYTWAAANSNIRKLQECAVKLVASRRRRADPRCLSMWERFATAARYTCNTESCPEDTFYDVEKFRAHFVEVHDYPQVLAAETIRGCREEWAYPPPPTA